MKIKPESDSLLKVRIKEAFGVNTQMVLCSAEDCIQQSTQVGTTEVLFVLLSRGVEYYIELSFAHSIIVTDSFFTCPHLELELSMISVTDATNLVSEIENPVASLGQTSKTNTQSQGKSLQKQAISSGSASGTGSMKSVLESIDKLD